MEDEEEEGAGAGWLVSFADLMTLLFAAFVVLYGITPRGKSDQIVGVASSIREAFVEIPEEIPDPMRQGDVFDGKAVFQAAKRETPISPNIKKFNRIETKIRGKNEDLQRIEIFLKQKRSGDGVQFSLRQGLEVSESEFGFNLKLLAKALFVPGTNELTPAGQREIRDLVKNLSTKSNKIFVEGHVDQSTPKGNYTHLELAALRATTIRNILIKNPRVDPKKVFIASYGENRPIESNRTNKGRSPNSRVEIKMIYQE